MKKIKLLCLTYGEFDLTVRQVIEKIDSDVEFSIINGVSQYNHSLIEERINEGIDAVIARGANAEYIKEHFTVPIVDIKLSLFDYAKALYRAQKIGKNICIIVAKSDYMSSMYEEFESISKAMGININVIEYNDSGNVEKIIAESTSDVLIGGAYVTEIAHELKKPCVSVYTGEDTIIKAICEAKRFVNESIKENVKTELIDALVKYSNSSIIIIDDTGKITYFNKNAEKLFGVNYKQAIGKFINEVSPESNLEYALGTDFENKGTIYEINGIKVVDNQSQIIIKNKIAGAMSMIYSLSNIKKAEWEYYYKKANKNWGFKASATFNEILGKSKAIKTVINEAKIFSKSDASIMILGDTGTGKELFAQSIHNYSDRRDGPFVAINCSAVPESLLESELFGYEEGSFTGGKKGGKAGLFELADHGTIFLDEIGEMDSALQSKLLRVIQEKEIIRIGGEKLIHIDVRVISATNKNVYDVQNTNFRQDLLYRLNVLELKLPSLKQRENDTSEIFISMLQNKDSLIEYNIPDLRKVFYILRKYSWPGNIRELQNVCERFYLYIKSNERKDEKALRQYMVKSIGEERLLADILKSYNYIFGKNCESGDMGNNMIKEIKDIFSYSNDKIAEILGVSRTTLWRMTKK